MDIGAPPPPLEPSHSPSPKKVETRYIGLRRMTYGREEWRKDEGAEGLHQ